MVTLRQRLLQGRVGYGIGDYIRHHLELKHVRRSFADLLDAAKTVIGIRAIVMTTVVGESSLNTCSLSILLQSKFHGEKMPEVS